MNVNNHETTMYTVCYIVLWLVAVTEADLFKDDGVLIEVEEDKSVWQSRLATFSAHGRVRGARTLDIDNHETVEPQMTYETWTFGYNWKVGP